MIPMKFLLLGYILVLYQTNLHAQTSVLVQGIIKSQQGAIQGANVEFIQFINSKEVIMDHCITDIDGKFSSKIKIVFDKNVFIKVFKEGYQIIFQNNFPVTRNGYVGEIKLRPSITISGTVLDSINNRQLPDAEVFYFINAKLIKATTSNNRGYFEFDPSLNVGNSITVQVSKKGYYDKEQTMVISSEGANRMEEVLLPPDNSRGLVATIQVSDKSTGKRLKGVTLKYYDTRLLKYKDTTLSNTGELALRLIQRPGLFLNFELRKLNYKIVVAKVPIMENSFDNQFPFQLERDHNSLLAPALAIVSGVSVLGSVGMYILSTQQYNRYRKFDNIDRDTDYSEAQSKRTVSIIAAGVGIAAGAGYIITRIIKKNQERKEDSEGAQSAGRFSILNQSYCNNIPAIGLYYQF